MSRREQIRMSDPEVADFLREQLTVVCATNGHRGWPHLMPLWYVVRDAPDGEDSPRLWGWTYGKSQKVRNLERDPRATLQVETGVEYQELRGVMLRTEVVLHREPEVVEQIGLDLTERYSGSRPSGDMRDSFRAQAPKRVGLEFRETERVTWDHRKLGDTY